MKGNKSTENSIQFEIYLYVQILSSKKEMNHNGIVSATFFFSSKTKEDAKEPIASLQKQMQGVCA